MTGSADLTLVIDAGTQSVRAATVDAQGQIQCMVKVAVTAYVSPEPGQAELDVDHYWSKVCEATHGLMAQTDASRLAAVCVAAQRQTAVPVDADGNPLRPAIVWMDERRADPSKVVPAALLNASRIVGLHDILDFGVGYCRSNWIREHEPRLWEQTHKFLFLSGYLTRKLTGEFIESVANVYGPWPFEVRQGAWVGPRNLKAKLFPIEPEKLPDLVDPGSVVGVITPAAAAATGLPVGLPYVAGASDKACDLLGAGAMSPDVGYISYGTTATFNVFTRDYVEVMRMLQPYPAAVPGAFHTEIQVMRGMWLVSWFTEEFGLLERSLAQEQGRSPEELLDELVADVPAGSDGLVTIPTWTPAPQSDRATRGSVIGFSERHTRAHLYRSILEGLAMAMREGAETTTRHTKTPLTEVRVSGGGSRSDVLMQTTADAFDLPTHRAHTPETSAVGAGILAATGVGLHPSVDAAVAAMTRLGRTFEPNPGNVDLLDRLRIEVHREAPRRLLPLFRSLRTISGQCR